MASGASESELLAQFQSITGADSDKAKFFLDSAQGQLEMALAAFYDGEPEFESVPSETGPASSASQTSSSQSFSAGKSNSKKNSYGGNSNIHSLATTMSDEDEDDDDKETGQAFYAGGSSTSGQQILGPPKKGGQDFVKEMFKKAREQGAEVDEDGDSSSLTSRSLNSFGGTGFKLGSNDNDSEVVPSMSKSKREECEFTLKMWQNGFSLDDGPLRAYDDPTNREFLSCIMKGKVPLELVREAHGGEVNIKMEDHKHEEFVKPKVSVKPFQGAGHILGSVLPNMEIKSSGSAEDQKNSEGKASEQIKVDDAQPSTSLQVRLSNGTRLVVKLNNTHTVSDLRRYITIARPEYASTSFSLQTTFPNKELINDSETLETAGLLGAAILLRPK
ncbi:NSFL1 cofactor p47 [Lepeophtheirus salmonis]|uniref:NSFL1 cofactor p47 n=2 Tax=Lepeophtheirus salmonis TaxID=72036 RepID=C1BUM8_LEPSM|nr:NSFL1 cofactor p47-like [Lepeophtheirus salmonis]ACO12731.1 NSFL1 cofactor p47 [Lepeophtheirus salmonis]